jgi:hypothetical protein
MPTIPRLERRTVTPSSRISSVATPNLSALGEQISGAVERIKDKRTQYQIAEARSKFNILLHQQNSAYDNDDDHETIVPRWEQSVSEGVDGLIKNISDPEARNLFMLDVQERVEANRPRINALAFSKESDKKVADLMTDAEKAHKEIVETDDPIEAEHMINSLNDRATKMAEVGWMKDTTAVEFKQRFKQEAALGRLMKAAPADRKKLLQDDIIKNNVPPEKLAELERQVDDDLLNDQAEQIVTSLGSNFSLSDLWKATSKIENTDLKRKVEIRGEDVHKNIKAAKLEMSENLYQREFLSVLMGEKKLDTNSTEFNAMLPQHKSILVRVDQARKVPPKTSNIWTIDKLNGYIAKKDYEGLRKFLITPDPKTGRIELEHLAPKDQAFFSKISQQGEVPEDWDSPFTVAQTIASEFGLGNSNSDVATMNAVRNHVLTWMERQANANVKITDKDTLDEIRNAHAAIELDPTATGLFDSKEEKQYYKLDDEERVQMIDVTLKNPSKVKDAQLNIVMRDMLENDKTDRFEEVLNVGLAEPERLSPKNQERFVKKIATEFDPELSEMIINTAYKLTGRYPNNQQFLEFYESERRKRRKQP